MTIDAAIDFIRRQIRTVEVIAQHPDAAVGKRMQADLEAHDVRSRLNSRLEEIMLTFEARMRREFDARRKEHPTRAEEMVAVDVFTHHVSDLLEDEMTADLPWIGEGRVFIMLNVTDPDEVDRVLWAHRERIRRRAWSN